METVQITEASALSLDTTNSFGSISSVASVLSGGASPTVTVGCDNGRVIPVAGRKISGVITELGQIDGITASTSDPSAASIDASDADLTNGEIDVDSSAFEVRADTYSLVRGLQASALVTAERGSSGLRVDLSSAVASNLAGGTEASPVGTTN